MAKKKVSKGKSSQECIDAAQKALSLFDHEELHEFMNDVFEKAKTYEGLGRNAALRQALKDIGEDQRKVLLSNCATKANNISKFNKIENDMAKKKLKMYQFLRRSSKNKSYNVESAQKESYYQFVNFLFSDMTPEQIDHFQSKVGQDDIASAHDGLNYTNPMSKIVADKLKGYWQFQREKLVQSNAMPIEYLNENRMLGNIHDRSKLISNGQNVFQSAASVIRGKRYDTTEAMNTWVREIKNNIDIERTFGKTNAKNVDGSINNSKANTILENIYRNITEDRSEIFTRSIVANDKEAVKRRSRMFFEWKGLKGALDYSRKYGSGDLFQDVMKDIRSSSSKIGMAEILGDSPDSMFIDMKKASQKVHGVLKTSDRQAELIFKQVSGRDQTAYDARLSNFGSAQRQLTGMSRLALLPFQSLSDITQGAGMVYRHGFGFWEAAFHNLRNIFNNPLMATEERKYLGELFKTNIDTTIGYMGKYADSTNMGNLLTKFTNKFYEYNFTHGYDHGNKLGTIEMLAKNYGRQSSKMYSELNDQTRYQWEQHGLNEHEWEALKGKSTMGLLTQDNVDKLSKKELKGLWEKSDKSIPFVNYKNSLYRNVFSMFDIGAETAVVNPGAFEKMIMTGNQRPGTYWGEAIKSLMQFKGFPIGFVRRHMIEAYNDLQGSQRKMLYAVNMMVATFPLSYASIWLGYAARGLTMPSFSEMSVSEKVEFMTGMLLPGLGMFLTILDPHKQNPQLLQNLAFTPSIKLLGNEMATVLRTIFGNFSGALDNLEQSIKMMLPISSIPFVEPIMNKILGKEPYLQPGQEKREGVLAY